MLVGTAKGKILYYENVAVPGNIPQMVLRDTAYQRLNPGENCTPQLIDLDRDGLTDLVCGKKNGKISYYRNIGSLQSPIFSLVTDFLGEVNVTNPATSFYGYSAPCFFEDSIGRYRLFVGTEQGNIFYYKNIDNNLSGSFQLADTITYKDNNHIYDLDEGMYAGVAIADINHDGYQDLIVGNYAGGLTFYKGIIPPAANLGIESHSEPDSTQILIYPNPANDYFNLEIKNSWQTSINQVELLDLFGNTLYQMSFDKNTVVNTYGISPGLYIIRLKIFYKNEVVKIFNQKLILE